MSASNSASANGSASALPSTSSIRVRRARRARRARGPPRASRGSGRRRRRCSRACATSSIATAAVPVATSSTRSSGPGFDAGDQEAPPARVLAEREQGGVTVVGRPERGEQLPCGDGHARNLSWPRWSSAKSSSRSPGPPRSTRVRVRTWPAVMPAESGSGRVYLAAYREGDDATGWLLLDANGVRRSTTGRRCARPRPCRAVRGRRGQRRRRRARRASLHGSSGLRLTENPAGLDEAIAAVDELERDDRHAAARRLDRASRAASELPCASSRRRSGRARARRSQRR